VDKDIPKDIFQQMDMRGTIIKLAGGSGQGLVAKWYIKNKTDDELIKLIQSQKPKRCFIATKEVAKRMYWFLSRRFSGCTSGVC